jgi:hypothetical protein
MIASREDGRNVERLTRDSFSHTRNRLCEIEYLDRPEQCFARVAAKIMTLSTDQTILNKRHRKACGRKLPHGRHTADPTAYDDDVEVITGLHLPSLPDGL